MLPIGSVHLKIKAYVHENFHLLSGVLENLTESINLMLMSHKKYLVRKSYLTLDQVLQPLQCYQFNLF